MAALDMPGRAGETTPIGAITLGAYVQCVVTVLIGLPEPAVLVGHSSGGVAITQAAESDGSARLEAAVVRDALFADCAQADLDGYLARAVPVPLAAAATPVKVTAERFGRVPRAYIECERDRGISAALQRRMHTAAGCDPVVSMDTGHMPMYAAPAELAAHLLAVTERS